MRNVFTALVLATIAAFAAFTPASAFDPVAATPQASGTWAKVKSTGGTGYFMRVTGTSGTYNSVKLPANPPSGANVLVQALAVNSDGSRITWTNTSGSNYTPADFDAPGSSTVVTAQLTQSGGLVGTGAVAISMAKGRYFDAASTYAPSASATDVVACATTGGSGAGTFSGNGSACSVRVTPSVVTSGPSAMTVTSNGVYSVDLYVSW